MTLIYSVLSAFIASRAGSQIDVLLNLVTAVACAISTWKGRLGNGPDYRFSMWVIPLLLVWTLLLTINGVLHPPIPVTAYTILPFTAIMAFALYPPRRAMAATTVGWVIMMIGIINDTADNWQLLIDDTFLCLLIAAFAQFGRPVIDVEKRAEKLAQLALLDPLTGLENRRAAQQNFDRWEADVASMKQDVAVLILDLDHFKQVNDEYGHDAGDLALRAVAQVLREHLRAGDAVYRWGGEEFVVVLADVTPHRLSVVTERLRAAVEAYRHEHLPPLTLSGGLAMLSEGQDWPRTLGLADARLYEAKQSGRNRIVTTGRHQPAGPVA